MALITTKAATATSATTATTAVGVPTTGLPSGSVLNVYNHQIDPGSTTISSQSLVDTGLTITVTPVATNSKFLLMANMYEIFIPDTAKSIGFNFVRDGSAIGDHQGSTQGYISGANNVYENVQVQHIDIPSPSDLTPIVYKVQVKSHYGSNVTYCADNTTSTFTIFEIKG